MTCWLLGDKLDGKLTLVRNSYSLSWWNSRGSTASASRPPGQSKIALQTISIGPGLGLLFSNKDGHQSTRSTIADASQVLCVLAVMSASKPTHWATDGKRERSTHALFKVLSYRLHLVPRRSCAETELAKATQRGQIICPLIHFVLPTTECTGLQVRVRRCNYN